MPGQPMPQRAVIRRARDHELAGLTLRWLCVLAILGLAIVLAERTASAAVPAQATSSRAAREDALRSIPLDKLDAQDRAKVTATVSGNSIFRRLPLQVTACDPDLYLFLVRHPEVVVAIWEVMKISNVAIARTGPLTFRASDGAGTLCQIKYCHSTHDTQVIYAEGSYDGPLLSRPVRASCVLVLKSGYLQETDGSYYVTSRMDTFIAIENAGVDLLAKTLQPLVNRSADYNFCETATFLGALSRATETNPQGVCRLANRLANVDEDARRTLIDISLSASQRANERQAIPAAASVPVSPAALQGSTERR